LDRHIFNESEMALFYECTDGYAQKVLDTADIVRDAIYRQLTKESAAEARRVYYGAVFEIKKEIPV